MSVPTPMVLGEGGAKMQGMVCFMTVKNLMAVSFLKLQVHVAFAKEEAAS